MGFIDLIMALSTLAYGYYQKLPFAIVAALSYSTFFQLIPFQYVQLAQTANMPAVVVSRSIQAITNITNGHTKQLSFITVFLSFAGCAARVFTSLKDAEDQLLAQTFIVSTAANGLILFQVIYYSYMKKQKVD